MKNDCWCFFFFDSIALQQHLPIYIYKYIVNVKYNENSFHFIYLKWHICNMELNMIFQPQFVPPFSLPQNEKKKCSTVLANVYSRPKWENCHVNLNVEKAISTPKYCVIETFWCEYNGSVAPMEKKNIHCTFVSI